jgi:hypothetical protein
VNGASLLGLMLLVGSSCALALLYFEYVLVRRTSSLTLCVAGIGKEILALSLSGLVFSEHLTLRQWLAVGVSLMGIYVFSRVHQVGKKKAIVVTHLPGRHHAGQSFRPVPTLSHLDIIPFE